MATDLVRLLMKRALAKSISMISSRRSHAVFKAAKGSNAKIVAADFGDEAGAGVDARFPAASARRSSSRSRCRAGAATSASTSRTSTTISSRPITRARPGTTCRRRSRKRSTSWAFPRPRRSILAGVKAQFESEVVYGSLQEDLGKQGRDLHRYRYGAARTSRSVARILRQDHSAGQTTSSRRSTRPSGRAVRSSTCPRA